MSLLPGGALRAKEQQGWGAEKAELPGVSSQSLSLLSPAGSPSLSLRMEEWEWSWMGASSRQVSPLWPHSSPHCIGRGVGQMISEGPSAGP